mgnify:CR=1 FL=1
MNGNDKNGREQNAVVMERPDSAYGGCRYRLSYDKYENNGSQKIKGKSFKLSSLFIAVAVFAIFIALGFFILKYYNNTVSRIYSGTSGASKTAASFQALADTNSED